MKVFIMIAAAFSLVAIIGMVIFNLQGQFDFITFFTPIWNFIEMISRMLQRVLEWFSNLIEFINPTTIFTGRIITC